MPQDKRPLGLRKPKAAADKTRVSKIVKDPTAGPDYSQMNKMELWAKNKLNAKDTADYKEGYRVGFESGRKNKFVKPDKEGNPQLAFYPFRDGRARFWEGRYEGELKGKKKK